MVCARGRNNVPECQVQSVLCICSGIFRTTVLVHTLYKFSLLDIVEVPEGNVTNGTVSVRMTLDRGLLYSYSFYAISSSVRGVLGNKCAGHHKLKTVKLER